MPVWRFYEICDSLEVLMQLLEVGMQDDKSVVALIQARWRNEKAWPIPARLFLIPKGLLGAIFVRRC